MPCSSATGNDDASEEDAPEPRAENDTAPAPSLAVLEEQTMAMGRQREGCGCECECSSSMPLRSSIGRRRDARRWRAWGLSRTWDFWVRISVLFYILLWGWGVGEREGEIKY